MSRLDWSTLFAQALPYAEFLDRHATAPQRERWDASHSRFHLDAAQIQLLGGFERRMPVLVLNGAWCGDCMYQCPVFAHFAAASSRIDLRFINRDAVAELREELSINGGQRVPVAVFLSEDFEEVVRYGDRCLSIYRNLAATQLGSSCPTGIVPPDADLIAAITREWLEVFERAQLILRLSPRFRQRHGD